MPARKHARLSFAVGASLVFSSSVVWASHNTWLLVDNGQSCEATQGMANSGQYTLFGGFANQNAYDSAVYCPVSLGGQFNGQYWRNGQPTPNYIYLHATVPSEGSPNSFNINSKVYYYAGDSSGSLSCRAMATYSDGSTLESQEVSSPPGFTGYGTMVITSSSGGWGGTLGSALTTVAIRDLGYYCTLPANTWLPWAIRAYSTNICVNNSQCFGG